MVSITQSRHHQGRSRAQIALPPRALRHSTLPSRVCRSFLKMVSMATLFVGLHLLLSVLVTLQDWLSQDHLAWFWPIGFVACIALALALYVSVHMLVRRRFRFSLKRLLIAVTLISFLLSLQVGRLRRAQARHSITALGGTMGLGGGNSGLSYAVEDEHEDSNKPFRPQWLRRSLAYVLDNASFDRVVSVCFRGSEINDADLVHLEPLPNIEVMNLAYTRVTDAGLVHLEGLTNLQRLSLHHTHITGLEHLKGLTKLSDLSLDNTQVTDSGLQHLTVLTSLKTLYLNNTQITDAGLVHLKGLTNLQSLNLHHTHKTSTGLEHLKGLTNLNRLTLDNTQVTDSGLQHLTVLTSLKTLYLNNRIFCFHF
jgi:hypothetical protein